ncbi:uncharacterized protein [Palaemon carinicauda]|uniref:uncharacterized protein n=1 Tax=Palaemon carinicauda TaxID=392227 RepID=UPI0035B59B26
MKSPEPDVCIKISQERSFFKCTSEILNCRKTLEPVLREAPFDASNRHLRRGKREKERNRSEPNSGMLKTAARILQDSCPGFTPRFPFLRKEFQNDKNSNTL